MKKILLSFIVLSLFAKLSFAQPTGYIDGYAYYADSLPSNQFAYVNQATYSGSFCVFVDSGNNKFNLIFDTLVQFPSFSIMIPDTNLSYYVLFKPDSVANPNLTATYVAGDTVPGVKMWHQAKKVDFMSGGFAYADVYVLRKPDPMSGSATIVGRMRDNTCNCTGKTQGPGDPFNGVDVSLIDKSTGSAIAVTTTDNDTTPWSGGNFTINNVPTGVEYQLYCDLSGNIIDTTWSFTVNASETVYFEVIVESDHMWYQKTTSIEGFTHPELTYFSVYPNPVSSSINVSYELEQESKVIISLYDILGSKRIDLLNGNRAMGKHMDILDISSLSLPKGIYFINLYSGEVTSSMKIVVD